MVQLSNRVEVPATGPRLPAARLVIGAVVLAGAEAVVISRWLTGTGYQPAPMGLPDPGGLTSVGLPIAQFLRDTAGVAVVGLLLLCCLTISSSGAPARTHLVTVATRWAWVWAGSTLVGIAFTMSDLSGVPINGLVDKVDVLFIVVGTDRVVAQFATLWVAVALALFGSVISGRGQLGAALVLATAALLPSALTGHAGHHSSPTLAMVVLAIHIAAAALWVGGLLAMVVHLRTFPDELEQTIPRFSSAALCCLIAVGVSGVIESAVMLDQWNALWGSVRGQLIIAKGCALMLLAGIGWLHRRHTMGAAASGRFMPLLRLAAGELLVMGATMGVAVVLSATA